ncbi:MAG: hypothetical protein IID31_09780 [Planctomycetes bacterium]|nr:hypothetical protein [Planctomycetota bacterium]
MGQAVEPRSALRIPGAPAVIVPLAGTGGFVALEQAAVPVTIRAKLHELPERQHRNDHEKGAEQQRLALQRAATFFPHRRLRCLLDHRLYGFSFHLSPFNMSPASREAKPPTSLLRGRTLNRSAPARVDVLRLLLAR